MRRDTIIQLSAAGVLVASAAASGMLVPRMIEQSEQYALKYTDVVVEGAPPIVALGSAIGALRGLIVDFLWIKVQVMKDRGQLFEVMADSELITKLQPRFAPVWGFHGHNMAYNISVATHTEQQRWEWVQAGISLVREQGLRYNPNNVDLHRELAFWFSHKIEGYSDDAHLYYKLKLCEEWHFLLGEPPLAWDDRIEWIREIAEAADTIDEAERRSPGVRELVAKLRSNYDVITGRTDFQLDRHFLRRYGEWLEVTQQSLISRELNQLPEFLAANRFFETFNEIASDPQYEDQWRTLIAHIRKRVLLDEYNMDPAVMYRYTRELGPIDWRSGFAHALYFARLGSERAERRARYEDNIYSVINNDRIHIHAMQGLARRGRISFDFHAGELPTRFPEPEWIDTIFEEFDRLYHKYYHTRGGGGESFINFLQNFMSSAVRELYRSGEFERAQRILARLDDLFGAGTRWNNPEYRRPIEAFVREQIRGEYSRQPELAPSEAIAALRYGIRVGIGRDREDVWNNSLQFVQQVVRMFQDNESYGFSNKFGRRRIGDLIAQLEEALPLAFAHILLDPTIGLEEKRTLWQKADRYEPLLRAMVYNQVRPSLEGRFMQHPLAQRHSFETVFPPPAPQQMQAAQRYLESRALLRQSQQEEQPDVSRSDVGRTGN